MTILSSGGYINTLLGTIVPVVPIFMPYLALLLLFSKKAIAGILALFAAALISPASVTGAAALVIVKKDVHLIFSGSSAHSTILAVLAFVFSILLIVTLAATSFSSFIKSVGTVASIALIPLVLRLYPLPVNNSFYADLVRQPWLPAERVTLTTRQDVIIYALSSDGDWFEVLMADTRAIKYYRASEVTSRVVCQTGETAQTHRLITLVHEQPKVPSCVVQPSPVPRKVTVNWLPPVFNLKPSPGHKEVPIQYLFPRYASHSVGG